jgi:hypothetical protein
MLTKDQEYITHYNYAKCINGMFYAIKFDIPNHNKHLIDTMKTQKFYTLAKFTTRSINREIEICKRESEYSEVVAHWIPVKSYYRTYYLEAILIHLSSGDEGVYRSGGHTKARNIINSYCQRGYLKTRDGEAEKVKTISETMSHRIKSGANISPTYFFSEDCIKSVRKKIAKYIDDQWRNNEKLNYQLAADRQKRDLYRTQKKLTFLDYFYQMRLKANYRDSDYLDFEIITHSQSVEFISMFNSANMRYVSALREAIDKAAKIQGVALT